MSIVSAEEIDRLYALERKVKEILDKSMAFHSAWEFSSYDMDADGMQLRKDLEELLDQGDGHAVTCGTGGGCGGTAVEEVSCR